MMSQVEVQYVSDSSVKKAHVLGLGWLVSGVCLLAEDLHLTEESDSKALEFSSFFISSGIVQTGFIVVRPGGCRESTKLEGVGPVD